MMAMYAFERRGRRFILAFAVGCLLSSAYGFLAGAWPFGIVEIVWSGIALRRYRRSESLYSVAELAALATCDRPYDCRVNVALRGFTVQTALVALALALSLALSIAALVVAGTSSRGASTRPSLQRVYRDGAADEPGYFVSVVRLNTGRVAGSMNYRYQDGQTSVVFTFQALGPWTGGSSARGILTLMPKLIPQGGSASQKPSTVPSAISATYDSTSMSFGECTDYLHFASSLADCDFVRVNGDHL